jgi:hypothetical protein
MSADSDTVVNQPRRIDGQDSCSRSWKECCRR